MFRGEYYHRIFNNDRTDLVEGYSTLNVSATFQPMDTRWRVKLSFLNLTDEPGVNSKFTDVFGVGATSIELIPPRQIMVGLQLELG